MKKRFVLYFIIFILLPIIYLSGFGAADGGRVTARDVLKQNTDADIIKYDGGIYSNMTEVDWFKKQNEKYTIHHLIGEIKKQSTNNFLFTNLTATKLPVGTKVYSTNENSNSGILIVEYEGGNLYYMELLEG